MRALIFCLALLVGSAAQAAQQSQGAITASAASCTLANSTGCVVLVVPSTYGNCALSLSGTFSGTISFEVTVAGSTVYTAQSLTNLSSAASESSATAAGTWAGPCGGVAAFRVRAGTFASGTAVVTVSATTTANLTTPGPIGGTTPSTGVFTQVFGEQTTGNGTANSSFNINGTTKTMSIIADTLDSAAANNIAVTRYSSSATRSPDVSFFRAHGSQASPTVPSTSDIIMGLRGYGYDGTRWQSGATILGLVDGSVSANIVPGRLQFLTTNSSGVNTSALVIDSTQKATFAGAVAINAGTGATTINATAATARAGLRVAATRVINRNSSVAIPDCAGGTLNLTVTQFLDAGFFTCGSVQTVNFPSWQGASGIVQNLPDTPAVGDVVEVTGVATGAFAITMGFGTGGTNGNPGHTTIPVNSTQTFRCVLTSVAANSEAATCY